MGSEVWALGSMVIITGLAAGQATAGAAASDGRSRNAGNGGGDGGAWGVVVRGSGAAGSAGGLAGCASRRRFLRLRSGSRRRGMP